MNIRSEHGFTLVELIVTLVIVGILAAAALTRYLDLSSAAKSGACRTNQLSMESAQAMHFSTTSLEGEGSYATQFSELADFIKGGAIPQCPGGGTYSLLSTGRVTCSIAKHHR